jgi:hypothetical protein
LFKESVDAHNSTNIASQISPTSGDSQVLDWIEAVSVDHEIAVVFVHGWSFASISAVEEFW